MKHIAAITTLALLCIQPSVANFPDLGKDYYGKSGMSDE